MKEPRESLTGRAALGCGAMITLAVPIWLLFTAIVIQMTPELSGFDAVLDGQEEVRHVGLAAWVVGGLRSAIFLGAGLPIVLLTLAVARAVGGFGRRRERADRLRYDALVGEAAVIRDDAWSDAAPIDDTA